MNAPALADVEDRHDGRMMKAGSRPRLPAKPHEAHRIARNPIGKHFQSDMPGQRLLHGLVYDPHATAPDLAKYAVVAEPLQTPAISHGAGQLLGIMRKRVGLFQNDQGGEHVPNFICQFGVLLDVIRDRPL